MLDMDLEYEDSPRRRRKEHDVFFMVRIVSQGPDAGFLRGRALVPMHPKRVPRIDWSKIIDPGNVISAEELFFWDSPPPAVVEALHIQIEGTDARSLVETRVLGSGERNNMKKTSTFFKERRS
jgi:hypothetical protein